MTAFQVESEESHTASIKEEKPTTYTNSQTLADRSGVLIVIFA